MAYVHLPLQNQVHDRVSWKTQFQPKATIDRRENILYNTKITSWFSTHRSVQHETKCRTMSKVLSVSHLAIHVARGHLQTAYPCSRSSCVVPKRASFNQKKRPINVSTSHLWEPPETLEQQFIHVARGHLHTAYPCSRSSCVVPKRVSFNQKQRPITVSTSHLWQTSRNVRNNSYTWRMVTYRLQIHVERSSFVVPRRTGFNQKQRPINVSTSHLWQTSRNGRATIHTRGKWSLTDCKPMVTTELRSPK